MLNQCCKRGSTERQCNLLHFSEHTNLLDRSYNVIKACLFKFLTPQLYRKIITDSNDVELTIMTCRLHEIFNLLE